MHRIAVEKKASEEYYSSTPPQPGPTFVEMDARVRERNTYDQRNWTHPHARQVSALMENTPRR